MRNFSLLLLFLLLPIHHATSQKTERQYAEVHDYFLQHLKGQTATPPAGSFSVKQLDEMRAMVWRAWCEAFTQTRTDLVLPAPDSLSAAQAHAWPLPASLEPNATMPFYFGAKGQRPESGYPLFLYLHGSGPKAQEWSIGLQLAQSFEDAPSLYFVPQIPNEGQWYRWWQRSKQVAWDALLRQALVRQDVNPRRLYVFGISEGGYGSQRLASFYADYLAAAGPMAGGEPLKNAPAENLSNTALPLPTAAKR